MRLENFSLYPYDFERNNTCRMDRLPFSYSFRPLDLEGPLRFVKSASAAFFNAPPIFIKIDRLNGLDRISKSGGHNVQSY
jgi:hypothetical protein